MKAKFVYISVVFGALIFSAVSAVQAQSKDNIIDRKISIDFENAPPAKIFHDLIYEKGVPIGLEIADIDRETKDFDFETNLPAYTIRNRQSAGSAGRSGVAKSGTLQYSVQMEVTFPSKTHFITLKFENASLRDIFDSLTRQMGDYTWESNGGVINIFPKSGRDARFAELLDLKVKNFAIGTRATLMSIQTEIYDLPEFKEFLSARKLEVTGTRYNAQDLVGKFPLTVQFSDLTIKGLLNNLAKIKKGGWILRIDSAKRPRDLNQIEIDI